MKYTKLIIIWCNRLAKFTDNPKAIFPFLKKKFYLRFIADTYIPYYKDITFLSYNETLRDAMFHDLTIIRFGDELFDMINGIGLYFNDWRQKYEPEIASKLKEVIASRDKNILLCFNPELIFQSKDQFKEQGIGTEWQFWINSKIYLKDYISKEIQYGSALCFNPRYNTNIPYKEMRDYFLRKHIIIVASGKERFEHIKLGKTTTFIESPKSDAWDHYATLKSSITAELTKYPKHDVLVLLSISTTGKILAYEFAKMGYTSWDTGQFFDLAYSEIVKIG